MTSVLTATVLSLVLAAPQGAQAGTGGKRHRGVHGVVTSVSGNSFTLRVGKKSDPNAREVTVQTNGNTKFFTVGNGSRTPTTGSSVTVKSHVLVVMSPNGGAARVVAIMQRTPRK